MRVLLAVLLTTSPPTDPWLGVDKMKHFLLSAMVESLGVSAARSTGMGRVPAAHAGAILTVSVGVGRELHDIRVGKGLSVKDLVWDGIGGIAAASLVNGAR